MDIKELNDVIHIFEENKQKFIDIVDSGELITLLTFMFNRCLNEFELENKYNFMNNFCHSLISIYVLSVFPVTLDKQVEDKMRFQRERMYKHIMTSINEIIVKIIEDSGIENISTTVH